MDLLLEDIFERRNVEQRRAAHLGDRRVRLGPLRFSCIALEHIFGRPTEIPAPQMYTFYENPVFYPPPILTTLTGKTQ